MILTGRALTLMPLFRIVRMAIAICFWIAGSSLQATNEIHGGWSPEVPYQFEETTASGVDVLRGLDIETMRAIARLAGWRLVFDEVSWTENLRAVKEGTLDFAMAATPNESRSEWAWFSAPYRRESISMLMRAGESSRWAENNPVEGLKSFLSEGRLLAVVRDFFYGPEVSQLLADERFQANIRFTDSDADSLAMVLSGEVDAMLGDRLATASVAWELDAMQRIEELPGTIYESDLCFLFSKKTFTPEKVAAFDKALLRLKESGEIEHIARNYLVPRLLLITTQSAWFHIFELIGTVAFAVSGVIIARRERYDVIGAIVLATLPAVGGGIIRDLISGRSPIGIMKSPTLILLVLATVFFGILFFSIRDRFFKASAPSTAGKIRWLSSQGGFEISDAIGLAAFTIIGVVVALEQRCEPLWLWGPVMAALTAAGGGVLRDVLRAQADIPTLKGAIYPEISILWGLIYSLVLFYEGARLRLPEVLVLTTSVMLGIFVTRLLVVQFGLRSPLLTSTLKIK